MIHSTLKSTAKIFMLEVEVVDTEIVKLVRRNFQDGSRVTMPQLLIWSSKTEEIHQFFGRFRLVGPSMVSHKELKS